MESMNRMQSSRREAGFPTLFISHGAPTLAIDGSPAHVFLKNYGLELGKPDAIIVLSAHYESPVPSVTSGRRPFTIHDFGGFPQVLHDMQYPAPGHPELAAAIVAHLGAGGIDAEADPVRGLDHGAWVPLVLMYPDADVPVVQVSIDPARGAAWHSMLGACLAPLRERAVMIVGSGSATHNLGHYFRSGPGNPTPDWVAAFNDWLADRVSAGDIEALLDYRARAPFARENHPTEEHFLPLLAALGAAGGGVAGRRVHQSYEHGVLSMDTYAFGGS